MIGEIKEEHTDTLALWSYVTSVCFKNKDSIKRLV